jgi:hypothetical protein
MIAQYDAKLETTQQINTAVRESEVAGSPVAEVLSDKYLIYDSPDYPIAVGSMMNSPRGRQREEVAKEKMNNV